MIPTQTYNTQHSPSTGYVLFVFLLFLLLQIFSSVIVGGVLMFTSYPDAFEMALSQALIATCTYVIPPLLNEYYYRRRRGTFVFRDAPWGDGKILLYSIALFALSYVVMVYSADINALIGYPEWLGRFGETLQGLEAKLNASFRMMLSDKSPSTVVFTFLSIVVIAPIGEELLFRGAVQGWMLTRTKNVHLAVCLSAILFSAVHMQWMGFIPRTVIGLVLGYVAVYGSLRLAILLHALNNLLAYIQFWVSESVNEAPEIVSKVPVTATLVMLICLGLSVLVIKKMRERQRALL